MRKNKNVIVVIAVLICISVAFLIYLLIQKKSTTYNLLPTTSTLQPNIMYYTCGMHPSVKVSVEEYNRGNTMCPICNMNLTPVHEEEAGDKEAYYGCGMGICPHCDLGESDAECKCGGHSFAIKGHKIDCSICGKPLKKLTQEEADSMKSVVSRVKIKDEQARLAGVKTEPVQRRHLHKEIRTAGKVAYDPQLAIAQEEFVSSLKALNKVNEGEISEIKERTASLLESSKRRLRLLGMSESQIMELEKTREIQTSLILPEKKMWIYADAYEYEMSWVRSGEKVKISTSSLPGEEFLGVISSVNPVINPKTRAVTFRAEVDNPGLKLKPEMYVDVIIMSMYAGPSGEHMVLSIPTDAVLNTGVRKIVWVDTGNGEYEGRIVELGPEAAVDTGDRSVRFYPVLKGLSEGEQVVTKANFLIDSQSQITGTAASSYSGAIGDEDKQPAPNIHQH